MRLDLEMSLRNFTLLSVHCDTLLCLAYSLGVLLTLGRDMAIVLGGAYPGDHVSMLHKMR